MPSSLSTVAILRIYQTNWTKKSLQLFGLKLSRREERESKVQRTRMEKQPVWEAFLNLEVMAVLFSEMKSNGELGPPFCKAQEKHFQSQSRPF